MFIQCVQKDHLNYLKLPNYLLLYYLIALSRLPDKKLNYSDTRVPECYCCQRRLTFLLVFFLFFFNLLVDGKIVLPGNLLAFTFYGKLCNIVVMKVKGTDGAELTAQGSATSSDTHEADLERSDLETSTLDLSLQLGKMDVDDSPEVASMSTPSKLMDPGSPLTSGLAAAASDHGSGQGDKTYSKGDGADLAGDLELAGKGGSEGFPLTGKTGSISNTDAFYFISSRTRINFIETRTNVAEDGDCESRVTYDMIGGLSSQLRTIRETVELPLKQAELFKSYGMMPKSWLSSFDTSFFSLT